ncbi:GAF domain-containing protein [bacterium]|nr:GAF domain-containing protein [bacterium]
MKNLSEKGLGSFFEEELRVINDQMVDLSQKLKKVSLQAKVLEEISFAIGSSLPLNKLLDLIMDSALKVTETKAGSILLVDEEKEELVFEVAKGGKAEKLIGYRIKIGEGVVGRVASEGRALIVSEAEKSEDFKKKMALDLGYQVKDILCVPIKVKERVIGVIEVLNSQRSFTLTDQELLIGFANQAGVVINNTCLLERVNKKIKELDALLKISQSVNSTLKLSEVLKETMIRAEEVLRGDASSLLLIDKETGELVFEVALGEKGDKVEKARMAKKSGIAGWVAEKGESLKIENVQEDPRFCKEIDEKTGYKTKNMLCVPLKVKDEIIGVAQVLNSIGRDKFSDEDLKIFEGIAHQAAVGIQNARLYQELQDFFIGTIKALAQAIEAKDPYTRGHSERVTTISLVIGKELGLPSEDLDTLKIAGLLHDIGKIGIDEAILTKSSKLTNEEFEVIKTHPNKGAEIVLHIKRLKNMIEGIQHHHEKFNGQGYPGNLTGEKIPLFARIIAVADAFDAMTSNRSYRNAMEREKAIEEVKNNIGSQFDPLAASAFLRACERGKI